MRHELPRDIRDGDALYHDASFLDSESADVLFKKLREEAPWQRVGRFPRLVAFYADDGVAYTYSRVTHHGSGRPPYLADGATGFAVSPLTKSRVHSDSLFRVRSW